MNMFRNLIRYNFESSEIQTVGSWKYRGSPSHRNRPTPRLGRDRSYELRDASDETMIYIAFAHQLLSRSTWFLDMF
jgi:hypothetical protein